MHLTYRPASIMDISLCAEMLPDGFCSDPEMVRFMFQIWRIWLQEERMLITILEDADQKNNPVVAFGCSVFVTDDFVQEAATCVEPPIALDLARRVAAHRAPVLDYEAISRANLADGLNLLVPLIGWSHSKLTPSDVPFVKAKLIEAFEFRFGGYMLKDIMQEIYSEAEMQRGLMAGLSVRSDYAWYYQRIGRLPLPNARPYLLGVSREEAKEGATLSRSFLYTPPRFFFKRGERDLLVLAGIDQTDEEISQALCISLSTVQKRWRSIYDRVAAVAPDLLPGVNFPGPNGQRTGSEKKRLILRYLKHHPEELRPATPPEAGKETLSS